MSGPAFVLLVKVIAERDLAEYRGFWPIPRDARITLDTSIDDQTDGVWIRIGYICGLGADAPYGIGSGYVSAEGASALRYDKQALVRLVAPRVRQAVDAVIKDLFPFHEGEGLP